VKLARFRKTKVICFLLYLEHRSVTNTSVSIYTYKYIQNMFLKVEMLEEARGGGKVGNDRKMNNNEIH
jgi:hypothetical protein